MPANCDFCQKILHDPCQWRYYQVESKTYLACRSCAQSKFESDQLLLPDAYPRQLEGSFPIWYYQTEPCPQFTSVTKQGERWKRTVELNGNDSWKRAKNNFPNVE